MEMTNDLVGCLDNDLCSHIMGLLNDPIDVVRAAAVSQSWHHCVIANSLCKKIFLKRFPHIAHIAYEIEGSKETINLSDILTVDGGDWGSLERDHRIYSSLLQPLVMPMNPYQNCLSYAIGASSTQGRDKKHRAGRYFLWSSEGQVDPGVPEYVVYKLCYCVCIVTEVNIQAFEEPENPIYSPTSVRFRFGYSRSLIDLVRKSGPMDSTGNYTWTYTSPEFPMAQEAGLQQFKLPEPIVCVGGVVQIEMLGRAQMDPNDGLFYIRLGLVRFMGQPLFPAYKLAMLGNGELQLKFYPSVMRDFHRRIGQAHAE